MRLQPRRVAVMLLSMVVVVGLLYGLQRWFFVSQTRNPLATKLMHAPAVAHVSLQLGASPPSVTVTLRRIPDLRSTYQNLLNTLHDYVPGAHLEVLGRTDSKIQSASEALSFPIQQGLATGQFMAMQSNVTKAAARLGIAAKIYIDAQNVYLALYDSGHAGYFVYPRGGN